MDAIATWICLVAEDHEEFSVLLPTMLLSLVCHSLFVVKEFAFATNVPAVKASPLDPFPSGPDDEHMMLLLGHPHFSTLKISSPGHRKQLNLSHDETRNDYIASLCENTNPDHRYIAEILLTSGLLLRALSSELLTFQHHSSGHPINPELFLVLEQTKLSSLLLKDKSRFGKAAYMKLNTKKWQRKLIFDAVNEIPGEKLGSFLEPCLKPNELVAMKFVSAQKLLKELCFEVQKLQYVKPDCSLEDEGGELKSMLREDVMCHSENWTGFSIQLPGVVLDVERQIFKDLIDELVIDEMASLKVKSGRHR
ncbi:hypothetical protein JHK82_043176 [Glycine max]|nr:hypothetical protein JHK82_043176 [Glycine max]